MAVSDTTVADSWNTGLKALRAGTRVDLAPGSFAQLAGLAGVVLGPALMRAG